MGEPKTYAELLAMIAQFQTKEARLRDCLCTYVDYDIYICGPNGGLPESDRLQRAQAALADQPLENDYENLVRKLRQENRSLHDDFVRCSDALSRAHDDTKELVTGLCDRIDRISQVCHDYTLSMADRVAEVALLSAGYAQIPEEPGKGGGE